MSRVLVIDPERCGLDFCLRAIAWGHEVRWARYSKRPVRDGDGFPNLAIVQDYRASIPWVGKDGLILTTGNAKYLYDLDKWREFGYRNILAPSVRSAALEVDRADGMALFAAKGLNVAPFKTFTTLTAAKQHVLRTDQNYAFKTLGDEDNKALTFVSSNPAQMAEWIDGQIKRGMVLKGECMLQEKIEFVAEVGIAGWMGPDGFLPDKWEVSFEHKKLCSGNYGPNTGEQGTVCQYVEHDPLADHLAAFGDDLRGRGHLGDFNINGGVDAAGDFWPFEATARLGWPDFYIRTAMHKGDFVTQLRDLTQGKDSMRVSRDPHIGVVMAQRPYPYTEGSDDEVVGKPIYGTEEVWPYLHPAQLYLGKGYVMTGDTITSGSLCRTSGAYVACVTGSGSSVAKARKNVYRTVQQIKLSDCIVRDDIGIEVCKELPQLHKLGYCTEVEA